MTYLLEKIIFFLFLLVIASSFFFDLKNNFQLWFLFEDLIYFSFLNFFLILFIVLNKNINLLEILKKNKIYILLILFFIFFFLKSYEIENLKLILYLIPLIFINELRYLLRYRLNLIFNKLFILQIIFLILIVSELITYKFTNLYLEDIFFYTNTYKDEGIKIIENSIIDKLNYEQINNQLNNNQLGFRLKIFLGNPISLYINFLLLSLITINLHRNKNLNLFSTLLVGFFTKTRLMVISVFLILYTNFFINKKNISRKIIEIIILILFLSVFFIYYPINNFSIKEIFYSRLIFYVQYLNQFNIENFFINLSNHKYTYINIQGYLTGSHSDLLFLLGNYGFFISIIFLYKILINFNKFDILVVTITIMLMNGLLFNSFFWVFLYLLILNKNVKYNYSN